MGLKTYEYYVAERITRYGWILYYRPNNYHSKKQIEEFGNAVEILALYNTDEYSSPIQINRFPLWYNSITRRYITGFKQLQELEEQCVSFLVETMV